LKDNRVQTDHCLTGRFFSVSPFCGVLPQNKNPPVGSGGFDLRYFRLSSSGAVPDFRQNHITPVAKVDYLNKANNAYDDDYANYEHILDMIPVPTYNVIRQFALYLPKLSCAR